MLATTTLSLALAWAAVGQADWYEPFPANKVIGNVYYVGSKDLASYLIATPEGHILINSGFERTVPLIRGAVESLGFQMSDIKVLLASHAHSDHVAGHADEGADRGEGCVMRGDDAVIASGGQGQYFYSREPMEAVPGRSRPGGRRRGHPRRGDPGRTARSPATPAVAPRGPGESPTAARTSTSSSSAAQRQSRLPAGRQQGLPRDRRRLRENLPGPQVAPLRRLPRRTRQLLRHDREARAAEARRGSEKNPFIDPKAIGTYVDLKEKAFRAALAAQRRGRGPPGPGPVRIWCARPDGRAG